MVRVQEIEFMERKRERKREEVQSWTRTVRGRRWPSLQKLRSRFLSDRTSAL